LEETSNMSNTFDPNSTPNVLLGRNRYVYLKKEYKGETKLDIRMMSPSLKFTKKGCTLNDREWKELKQNFKWLEYFRKAKEDPDMKNEENEEFCNRRLSSQVQLVCRYFRPEIGVTHKVTDLRRWRGDGGNSVSLNPTEIYNLMKYASRIDSILASKY